MTVCIAAMCKDDASDAIVLCADKRTSSSLGSAETLLKVRNLGHGWFAMTAGSVVAINRLYKEYAKAIANAGAVTPANVDKIMKEAPNSLRKALADEYTQANFSMSHDDFLRYGKERLPDDVFNSAIQEIRSLRLDAEFLLCGFLLDTPEIYHCDSSGKAVPLSDYGTIGEGEYLASASLLRRGQHDYMKLNQTVYNVYEAKKYSESVGSVGKETSLIALTADGKTKFFNYDVRKRLDEIYQEYGPKRLPEDLKFPEKVWDEI